jgi:hypothetical protein
LKRKPTVYLAGGITGLTHAEAARWRLEARKLLHPEFNVLDPVTAVFNGEPFNEENPTAREIIDSNNFQIKNSDIILAEFEHQQPSIGTVGEIVKGHCLYGMPIITWGKSGRHKHPWVKDHTTMHFYKLEDAVRYIKDNYQL